MSSAIREIPKKQVATNDHSIECDHCGLIVPPGFVQAKRSLQFCCSGCEIAYETIQACGLSDYYKIRERLDEKGQPARGGSNKYTYYDSTEFLTKHSQEIGESRRTIELCLDGVHCAACLWLIEALPNILPGLISARLTLRSSTVKLTWIEDQTTLSKIATSLDQLGYVPYVANGNQAREIRKQVNRKHLVDLAIAGALAGNCMLVAVALYAGMFQGIESHFQQLFRWLSMGLGLTSLFWPGRRYFPGAWAALLTRTVNLDLPISIALGAGALAGTINVLLNRGDIYFDSLSVLVFLLLVGRYIQSLQQRWAEDAVSLRNSLTPPSCRLIQDANIIEQPIEALKANDLVEVRSGELFPADGIVTSGISSIDLSLLTGESVPIQIKEEDAVFASSQNVGATLRVKVTKTGDATRIGRIMTLVEEGAKSKPPLVALVDRIAGWFLVIVTFIAVMNFLAWNYLIGLEPAIDHTVATLIVACPCALGLATPLTIAMAIGKASQNKVLIKDSAVIERLGSTNRKLNRSIYFDKTGTLTQGKLEVVRYFGDKSIGAYIAALEAESNHPIAIALHNNLSDPSQSIKIHGLTDQLLGGLSGRTEHGMLYVGSPRYLSNLRINVDQELEAKIIDGEINGYTVVVAAVESHAVAAIYLKDVLHEDSLACIQELQANKWDCYLLSGDAEGPVREIGQQLGFDPEKVHATKTPEEKLDFIRYPIKRKSTFKYKGPISSKLTVMVGDGVNDSAALASADVGIAVHGGAEASLAVSDVYIAESGTKKLVDLIRFCKKTMKLAYLNLFISLSYNIVAIGLALCGLVTPLIAAIIMPLSSATVLLIAVCGITSSSAFEK